ncbi:MAG: hypothetical protein PHD55_09910 [Methanoregula sp.]|nr:hypothetical protein [Methanoregula sp.]
MNAQISPEPTRNGFTALPQAEKEWFLIRVRELPRTTTNNSPALSSRAVI